MTDQEIYDKVAIHLLTQNKRSQINYGDGTRCVYKSPNGLMCAMGILIPDELYNETMEGENINNNSAVQDAIGLRSNQTKLANILQRCHDYVHPADWKKVLIESGEIFNLNTEIVSNFYPQL